MDHRDGAGSRSCRRSQQAARGLRAKTVTAARGDQAQDVARNAGGTPKPSDGAAEPYTSRRAPIGRHGRATVMSPLQKRCSSASAR